MESQRHQLQMELLLNGLRPWLEMREDGFVGGNMFVYYSLAQVRNRDFKGPDVFIALGVPKGERRSWVCWEEDKTPDVVIELLSESTLATDKNEKKSIYQDRMRVPEYFWYDPFNPEDWAGFQLQGSIYREIPMDDQKRRLSEALNLSLLPVTGDYKGIEATWLRWATVTGELLPTPEEQAEKQKAIQIAGNLLAKGMAIAEVAQVTGLAIAQVEALPK